MSSAHRPARSLPRIALVGAVVALAVVWAAPAAAHVSISDSSTDGDVTSVTFFFDHACDGSPTTGLTVQLPEGAQVESTEEPDGWSLVDDGGTVEWEGSPVPDHEPAEFTVALTGLGTSQDQPFPVIQTCEVGEAAWIDDEADSDYPAPVLAASGEPGEGGDNNGDESDHDVTATTTEAEAEAPATTEPATDIDGEAAAVTGDDDDTPVAAIVIAVIVVLALAAGVWYFVRSRKATA